MNVCEVTKENFEKEVLLEKRPVLVDMWADWCAPCRMLSPIVDAFAQSQEEVKVCKINVDTESGLAARFNVMNIPTLLLFQNAEVKKRSTGLISKTELEEFVKQ